MHGSGGCCSFGCMMYVLGTVGRRPDMDLLKQKNDDFAVKRNHRLFFGDLLQIPKMF